MYGLIFLLLTASFLTFFIAGVLLTLFKKQIAFNERVSMYFTEPAKNQKRDPLSNNETNSKLKAELKSFWDKGTLLLNQRVSITERKKLDQLLRDAGYPFKSAVDFRLGQLLLCISINLPMFMFILPVAEHKSSVWMIILMVAILGFRLPMFYLGKRKTQRIKEINKSMPDFFDTVTLLLEAGMGLDLAIVEVAKKMKGPLSEEFIQTLEDMKLGKSRREAFYELRRRVPSPSFQSVITSLIQADQLGIGMAKALGNLSVRIREQRRETARELAMKAPVKMLFPMVFFIFPSLFIVILGPVVIQLITKGLGG
ncbi:type II secretion system F family protein [Neobacillus cucumis]|uniref:Type II secretion system protein GspF domain-containing protein n=1 Tax=Neobacillus cucumis TaxID=1740721 RepID=A0A2N5HN14_9BACI|nr:type II secretion system F family protein [Neobacillus cucumis]PLS06921.1 hypothetical protein CVD27_06555 [Neobacillus cucumis]